MAAAIHFAKGCAVRSFGAVGRLTAILLLGAITATIAVAQPPAGPGGSGGPGGPLGIQDLPPETQAEVNYPGGITGSFDVPYASIPGFRPLTLDVFYKPADRKPADRSAKPAVLWVHGGGFAMGSAHMSLPGFGPFDKVLAHLAERGYVTAAINYRLSGEVKFPMPVQDVKAAIRWLRANAARFGIDPRRIAIWGESAGGYLASLVATSCSDPDLEGKGNNANESSCVQAAVDWYGLTDLAAYDAHQRSSPAPRPGGGSFVSAFLGCEVATCAPQLLKMSNVVAHVTPHSPPFLIMHGDSDVMVPWHQSEELRDALAAKGVAVTFTRLPGLNHIFVGATPQQRDDILRSVFQFLDRTLQAQPAGPKTKSGV